MKLNNKGFILQIMMVFIVSVFIGIFLVCVNAKIIPHKKYNLEQKYSEIYKTPVKCYEESGGGSWYIDCYREDNNGEIIKIDR